MTAPTHPQRERVHLALLGGLSVTVGDRAVPEAAWPSRRSAELVAASRAVGSAPSRAGPGDRGAVAAPGSRCGRGEPAQGRAPRPAGPRPRGRRGAERRPGRRCSPAYDVETDVGGLRASGRGGAALRGPCRVRRGGGALRRATCCPDALYEDWTQARRDHLRSLHVDAPATRAGGGSGSSRSTRPTSRPTASSCAPRWPPATGTPPSAGTGGCARTWSVSSACRPSRRAGPSTRSASPGSAAAPSRSSSAGRSSSPGWRPVCGRPSGASWARW